MALLIRGKTQCPICNQIIGEGDEAVGFSAFIADKTDPLWRFSDAPFHRTCYELWPQRAEFEAKYYCVMPHRRPDDQNARTR